VYNNYPWPSALSAGQQLAIEVAAQALLDARTQHADKSLAWMYKPETMPANVQAAHDLIDVAVDAAYAYEVGEDDAPRVAFLFKRYQELTSLLPQDDEAIEGDRAPVKSIKRRRTK
jgi:hypothetical protein